jgi:hypothetical protein
MTGSETAFARGLSSAFLAWLKNDTGRKLLDTFVEHDLDVRIRGDYLNAYKAECSVAKLSWQARKELPLLSIHRAYLINAPLLNVRDNADYANFDVLPEHVDVYRTSLPGILNAVLPHIGEEGRWEQRCVDANLEGTPFVVIDRQIVNRRPPVKLDMLAVATMSEVPTLVAVELKRDLDNRIQDVASQALKYVTMLDPTLIQPGMPVVGLVALANYNPKSQLLERALNSARSLERLIRFCHLANDRPTIPPMSRWFSNVVA